MTEERKRELAEMSDNWLAAMIEKKEQELEELVAEHDRRRKPTGNHMERMLAVPATLADLEREVHSFGDHYGFDAVVGIRNGMITFTEAGE